MSELVNGRIPAHTECPYRAECPQAEAGICHHKGVDHECEFSCALARLFKIVKEGEARDQK